MRDENDPLNQLRKLIENVETYPNLSLAVLVEEFATETIDEFSDKIKMREPTAYAESVDRYAVIGGIQENNKRITNIIAAHAENNKENIASLLYAWSKAKKWAIEMNGLPGIVTTYISQSSAGITFYSQAYSSLEIHYGWIDTRLTRDEMQVYPVLDANYSRINENKYKGDVWWKPSGSRTELIVKGSIPVINRKIR